MMNLQKTAFTSLLIFSVISITFAQPNDSNSNTRVIEFPDITGFHTLKCDFHMHTVFSDGSVWPNIRVQEAVRDGLDAISITDHLEYQPKSVDIPHLDRNRSYQLALNAAEGKDLIVISGAEITRSMPPGHCNALFVEDANKLNQKEVMEVFLEAKRQGAFVFWNHPHWTSQQKNGVATLTDLHVKLLSEGLIHGIETFNDNTHSDEAMDIAHEYNLTLMGNSDVHGLVDWQYDVPNGGHRPVTLVFAQDKSEKAIKDALEQRRTAVWFDNTPVGNAEYLVPLVENSLKVSRLGKAMVQTLMIENISDADYILENLSEYTLHNQASVFIIKAHETTKIQVKTIQELPTFQLRFKVLNAVTSPGEHPEINIMVE